MAQGKQLTPLAVAVLGLLSESAMHPYEMYQVLMHRHDDRLFKVRPGTLYHAVGRLAEAGLVEATGTARDGNRPERTNYAILPEGRRQLTASLCELLAQPAKEYPRFPQALSEAHNLPAHDVVELLGERTKILEQELSLLLADNSLALAHGVQRQFLIDLEYQQQQLRSELEWIGKFCAQLLDGSLPWGVHVPTGA